MPWIARMAKIHTYQRGVLNQEMSHLPSSSKPAYKRGINRMFQINIYRILYERTLVNSGEKHNVMCWRLIWRAKTDHPGCLCILPSFDVTESRFPKTLCSTGGAVGPKEFVAANDVPISCLRP